MILCDIGNTTVDIFENGIRNKYFIIDFDPLVFQNDVYFISVNKMLSEQLKSYAHWHNLENFIDRTQYYSTMGIDRIMVCEAIDDGVVVDAGSAITVDCVQQGEYGGGFIALGLKAAQEGYAKLSPALDVSFNFEVDLAKMAKNTPDAISLGFLAPLIEKIKNLGKPIYLCGGDAQILHHWLPDAKVDEELIFKGMIKLINKGITC